MCHAYVVWETRERGAGAREPLRFIPDFRWNDAAPAAPARPRGGRRFPAPPAPGWLRPALAGAVVLAVILPFIG